VSQRSNVRQQPPSTQQHAAASGASSASSASSGSRFARPPFDHPVFNNPLWVLLPLRLFLGITFLYAGLSKIAQSSFLDEKSPTSMHATLLAVKGSSPIGGLLGPVVDHTFVFGVFMALAETAVGIGTLLGLFSRIAALGGMVLSFSLFLTVSWGADPWYTGADIVYLVAFTPLILAGALPYSVDEWLARAAVRVPGVGEDRTRRALLAGGAAVGALVAVGLSSLFRSNSSSADAGPTTGGATPSPTGSAGSGSTPSPSASASSGAKGLVAASAVPVGGAKEVTDPTSGDQVWVLQLETGKYTAVDAKCPHQGCAVNFVSASGGFRCPCHQSAFTSTGALTRGPATSGLKAIPVTESNGQITRT
jgi:thiosulfate dehydrogenase (quinone) large subunit